MPNVTNVLVLKGYKYLLTENLELNTPFKNYNIRIETDAQLYAEIADTGVLKVYDGYAWDGVTGFREHEKTMLPSLLHDVLYQFMAMDDSPVPHADSDMTRKEHVNLIDDYFIKLLKANNVSKPKIKLFKQGIKLGSAKTEFSVDPIEIDYTNLFEVK